MKFINLKPKQLILYNWYIFKFNLNNRKNNNELNFKRINSKREKIIYNLLTKSYSKGSNNERKKQRNKFSDTSSTFKIENVKGKKYIL